MIYSSFAYTFEDEALLFNTLNISILLTFNIVVLSVSLNIKSNES
jgi:hypothetical protein